MTTNRIRHLYCFLFCIVLCTLSACPAKTTQPHDEDDAYLPPEFSAVAQTPFGSMGSARGELLNPTDMVTDLFNRTYITDAGNHRIQVLDHNGRYYAQYGTYGMNVGSLSEPVAIAMYQDAYLYVLDRQREKVLKLDRRLRYITEFPSADSELSLRRPEGLAVSTEGDILIADTGNDRVVRLDKNGSLQYTFGSFGFGDGFFKQPVDIETHDSGLIFVADRGNRRIQVFDRFGQYSCTIKVPYRDLKAIVLDKTRVYALDSKSGRIGVFTHKGKPLGEIRKPVKGASNLHFNSRGILFIADPTRHQVRRYTLIGITAQ